MLNYGDQASHKAPPGQNNPPRLLGMAGDFSGMCWLHVT